MKRSTYYTCLVVFIIFLATNCKHKEKQVTAHYAPAKKSQSKTKASSDKSTAKRDNSSSSSKSNAVEQKLGVSSEQVKDSKLYSFVDDWYGTPYKYGGCQKGGVDCSCFANILYDYVYNKKIGRTALDIYKSCDEVSLVDAQVGDFVFFKIGGSNISHVGVLLKNRWFVHASTSAGVVINSLQETYYKKYFFCAGKSRS
jgi:murein DD-endopeptidase / murein LD-carboxypeptidase